MFKSVSAQSGFGEITCSVFSASASALRSYSMAVLVLLYLVKGWILWCVIGKNSKVFKLKWPVDGEGFFYIPKWFLVHAGRSPQCCHPPIAKHWDNINLAVNCWSWACTALLKFSDAAVRNQLTDKYEVCFLLALWWLMQRWLWAATMGGGTEQWGEQNPTGNLSCWHPRDFRWKWGLIFCIHD